jgi:hypothetical protein
MSKVFISYSHDSPEHAVKVLTLANKLRSEGIDAIIDQYEPWPEKGWSQWMLKQVSEATFVLMICTEMYYKGAMDKLGEEEKKGVKYEWHLINSYFYQDGAVNKRFLPVIFKENARDFIPDPFIDMPRFCVATNEGYEDLYRRLTNQPRATMPELGKFKSLGVPEAKTNFFVDTGGDSGVDESAGEKPQQEEADGGAKGRATGGKHPKVVTVEEIAKKLKHRKELLHICHNDDEEKKEKARRCYVQRRAVVLAKDVRDFDRDADKILSFATALESIETEIPKISEKSSLMEVLNFKTLIWEWLGLFKIYEAGFKKMQSPDDELGFLKKCQTKILSSLPERVIKTCDADEIRFLVVSLLGFIRRKKMNPLEYHGKDYDIEQNLSNIKLSSQPLKTTILAGLQIDVESAHTDIHKAVKSFKKPPSETEASEEEPVGVAPLKPEQVKSPRGWFRKFLSKAKGARKKEAMEIIDIPTNRGKPKVHEKVSDTDAEREEK